jgi:diguanylate cyclase (GGDEF)-like protein
MFLRGRRNAEPEPEPPLPAETLVPFGSPRTAEARPLDPEAEAVKDTLARIVGRLADLALPTDAYPVTQFAPRCEGLVLELLTRRPPSPDASPRPLNHVCRDMAFEVERQRSAEAKEYRAHRVAAQALLEDLADSLTAHAERQGAREQAVVAALAAVEDAVSRGNLADIKAVTTRAAGTIRDMITQRRAEDRRRLDQLSGEVERMRTELAAAEAQSQRDPLTQLFNRGRFDLGLATAVAFAEAARVAGAEVYVGLFMLDLDHFKAVNDEHGHPAGDEVLRAVARQLERSFPRQDDLVCRYGGEEFAILCQQVEPDSAAMLGERARRAVEELTVLSGEIKLRPTISVGYAVSRAGESPEEFLTRADAALYEAKRNGRNRVERAA